MDIVKDWSIEEIRNRIWAATQCGQPAPGCVSVEAMRVELTSRGEQPIGYHENIEDIDMKNIEIENTRPLARRKTR